MFCYQESVSKGTPKPCTPEIWDNLIDSPEVSNLCRRIAALDPTAEDYNDRKQALKRRLPIIIPHAASFKNGKRISADAIPSGLAMLDVDHVDNPRDWFEKNVQCQISNLKSNKIYLVAITASGHGIRIIGERLSLSGAPGVSAENASSFPSDAIRQLESIEAAQLRIATALGIPAYDSVTKDLARASYVVPRDYILFIDESGLFSSSIASGLNPDNGSQEPPASSFASDAIRQLALPPHVDQSISPQDGLTAERSNSDSVQTGEAGLTYRGIPYADIVNQLLISTGNCGGAVQGERNTVYFSLAVYMRYICDFNSELLLQILPDFGLSEQERRQAISSAIGRPRKSELPVVVQGAIAICERERELTNNKSEISNQKSTNLALPPLPRLLKLVCRRLPEEYQPAMVIASLPILGTLATRIRFEYLDRQEQSLSFFSCITAPAASGKSFIRKPLDLLLTPINEQDAIEREKEQAYKEKLRASKNSKNQPEDPHACPRNNGVAISIAKLLQLLTYAEGKHLIGIGEEMDTLVKSERAGVWSQKSDIYRLAFDNAEYGQAYMSDASFNAHIKVYYNLLLTGTPNSMKRFFKDLENGLATRVCFAQLPDTSFSEIPVFAPYTESERAEIIRWARELDAIGKSSSISSELNSDTKGLVHISCPQLNTVISDWLEAKRQQAIDADSHSMDTLRRRAGVIGFRAGMLCYLLENRKFTKTVASFAEWVAEYVFRNQMELWGEQMEQEIKCSMDAQSERGAAASLLALLPAEFTAADLIKLRARKGQSVKSAAISMVLNRWRNNHRIEKSTETTWRKI